MTIQDMANTDGPARKETPNWVKYELSLDEYQRKALNTAVYPGQNTPSGFNYALHGLTGEAGEIANKYKKILRKEENLYRHREDLMDELGDVLWYAATLAKELGYGLGEVAQHNVDKLAERKQSGTLKDHK